MLVGAQAGEYLSTVTKNARRLLQLAQFTEDLPDFEEIWTYVCLVR
jgi:hypothetical protein